jgi:hypothetical protein
MDRFTLKQLLAALTVASIGFGIIALAVRLDQTSTPFSSNGVSSGGLTGMGSFTVGNAVAMLLKGSWKVVGIAVGIVVAILTMSLILN